MFKTWRFNLLSTFLEFGKALEPEKTGIDQNLQKNSDPESRILPCAVKNTPKFN